MLVFNLKKEWFNKIKSGEKTHEYREVKDYWTDKFVKEFSGINKKTDLLNFITYKNVMLISLQKEKRYFNRPYICFMNGMLSEEKRPRLYAKMKAVRIIDGKNTDLKINKPVYDIEFKLIKE